MSNITIHSRWTIDPTFIDIKNMIMHGVEIIKIYNCIKSCESQNWPKYNDKYDLRGIILEDIDLQGYKFLDCDLTQCAFEKTYLTNVTFANCIITSSQFEECSLRSAKFNSCFCEGTLFFKSNLCDSMLLKSNFIDSTFERTIMHGIIFDECILPDLNRFLNRDSNKKEIIRDIISSKSELIILLISLLVPILFYFINDISLKRWFYLSLFVSLYISSLYIIRLISLLLKQTIVGVLEEEKNKNWAGAAEIYLALKLYYKNTGRNDLAGEAHYRHFKNYKKSLLGKDIFIGAISYFAYHVIERFMGYGERLTRILRVSLFVILAFSIYYYDNNNYTYTKETTNASTLAVKIFIKDKDGSNNSTSRTHLSVIDLNEQIDKNLEQKGSIDLVRRDNTVTTKLGIIEAIYFSTVTFATLGSGDISPKLGITHDINELLLMIPAIESIIGCIMIATYVVVLARKIIRD